MENAGKYPLAQHIDHLPGDARKGRFLIQAAIPS
jgi:hypothetical protein